MVFVYHAHEGADLRPTYAGFRLTCRLPHCRFDDDICSTAQAPLAAEGWPSGKRRQANRSITLPLCPPRQIAVSWILCNSGAMPLGDKAKAALPLRDATLKQQAMVTRHSGKAASGKLVWNQHKGTFCCYWSQMQSSSANNVVRMFKGYIKATPIVARRYYNICELIPHFDTSDKN